MLGLLGAASALHVVPIAPETGSNGTGAGAAAAAVQPLPKSTPHDQAATVLVGTRVGEFTDEELAKAACEQCTSAGESGCKSGPCTNAVKCWCSDSYEVAGGCPAAFTECADAQSSEDEDEETPEDEVAALEEEEKEFEDEEAEKEKVAEEYKEDPGVSEEDKAA